MRLWSWEQSAWAPWTVSKILYAPSVYLRTGPGVAEDGGARFDLQRFNPEYFQRMRERIVEARDRGVYVAVMLFQGFSSRKPFFCGDPWRGHPFNARTNVNGFDGDQNKDSAIDLHPPEVRQLHTAYLKKVIDNVNDLDNVPYEVINEGGEKTGTGL